MTRKLMMLFAAFAAAFCAWAATETFGGYTWTYQINGGTAEIYGTNNGYPSYSYTPAIWPSPTGAVTIPSTLGGKPVTSIGDIAFYGCSSLTSVTIPDSVTSIGFYAFSGCNGLTSVTIPDSVTSIGNYAFYGCSGLTSVTIPDSVTSIGYYFAFYGCSGLTSVTIPQYICSLTLSTAFPDSYQSITNVVITDEVTSIGDSAFSGCSGLTSVTIPEGVTNIGDWAFSDCINLTDVSLPDSLVSCRCDDAFYRTPFLSSKKFPDFILSRSGKTLFGVKRYDAVWDYTAKSDVVIPATVTRICDYALGCFLAKREYDGEVYDTTFSEGNVRIVFAGTKPKASDKAFAREVWVWDGAAGEYVESHRIDWSGVYYHEGNAGWTWGAEWCGVKTYALNEMPAAYAKESNLKFGRVYGGEMPDAGWTGYSCWTIWDNNDIGLYDGDEYAFIPVTGKGTIKPVIYGDVPSGYLETAEIWTDQKMFDTFTPKGVATSKWKTDEDEDWMWYYETSKAEWEWPKDMWPEKKVVSDRRWIVIHAKKKAIWSGVWSFRVGLAGTSEISDPIIVVPSEEFDDNGLLSKHTPSDFMRSITFSGYDNFEAWDDAESCPTYSYLDTDRPRMQTFEIENGKAALAGKPITFKVSVPSAGTLVMSSEDDDEDSPAMKEVFSITGSGIVSDKVIVKSNDWESPDYRYNVTNFWKTSNASYIRRIEVNKATTLTFTSNTDEDGCEFNRMYFFPKSGKSVAIDVGYIVHEDHNGTYDYWGRNYVQGYVTGGGVYKSGETATLKAVSGDGEEFDHWEVCFGNLTLTAAQKTSPTLSFKVTDAMCGAMEDEAQIFLSAIWKPKYKMTALPSIVGAGTVTGTGRYYEGTTVKLSAVPAKGCTFVKWSDGVAAATRTVTAVPADVERIIYAYFSAPGGVPSQDAYAVFFDGNGGDVSESVRMVEKGKAVGTLPTVTREKYKFLGWFNAASGGTHVYASTIVKSSVTYYAHWTKLPDIDPDPTPEPGEVPVLNEEVEGAAPADAASEYNGYLYDARSGAVKGTIQVKVGKPGKKDGKASVSATVVVGAKKFTLKASDKGKAVMASDGPTEIDLIGKGAEACTVTLGADGISGYYGQYLIDGSRNFFASKDKGEVADANDAISKWLGSLMVIWNDGSLSVSIAAKGKVKVSGTLSNGKKVSASTVLLVGEEWSCASVAAPKANLSFVLWLSHDGKTATVEGLGDGVLVGKAGTLADGAVFSVPADAALWSAIPGTVLTEYLPDGVPVTKKGTKWTLPKAGRVTMKKGVLDDSKAGENPSGLKLTYKEKDGSFSGSFKVYAEQNGKLKATSVTVKGFLLEGVGYGTATIKKVGSVAVTIE